MLSGFRKQKKRTQKGYRRFVQDGKNKPSPWESLRNQIYLGSDQFVKNMQRKIDPDQSLQDIPKPQKQSPVKPLSYYQDKYSGRNRAMTEAYRSGDYTLQQMGDHFGVSYATVSREVQALKQSVKGKA